MFNKGEQREYDGVVVNEVHLLANRKATAKQGIALENGEVTGDGFILKYWLLEGESICIVDLTDAEKWLKRQQ